MLSRNDTRNNQAATAAGRLEGDVDIGRSRCDNMVGGTTTIVNAIDPSGYEQGQCSKSAED
ncbi:hypothetical protein BGZ73_004204 [Actinomortierella ambigua]|nr:hypothetical protein BGZ73_004204 [Actinomortierella ambigua]